MRSKEKMFAETRHIRESDPDTRFPDTREEVEREDDPVRKQTAQVIHEETHVKKTWTHGH